MKLHRLLRRQLKKANLTDEVIANIQPFLENISAAYDDYNKDVGHLEHILEKSSRELYEANKKLRLKVDDIGTRLQRVVNNIQEVIFLTDLEGNWTFLNKEWETLTGYTIDESMGKHYSKFFKTTDGKDHFEAFTLDSFKKEPIKRIFEFVDKNGCTKWVETSLKLLKCDNGVPEGVIGTLVDITKLKHTEANLLDSMDQAAKASMAKDEFLSTMSHEIRTPLNAVIGISHLLLLEDPKEEQLENLNALKYSSEHLLGLVNDILDFSKIESGNLELEEVEFSLSHILNGLQSSFQQRAEEKGIRFRIKKDDELPEVIKGDSIRLAQVLTNLVGNAIKFTEEGKVTLDIEVIKEDKDNALLHFEVIDTGIGIPEDKIQKVFESFTQANSDTTRKYGGTGLGLAICKKILDLLGSELKVSSVLGAGTTFSFDLNVKKSEKFSDKKRHYAHTLPSFAGLDGMRVLVVEDHKMNVLVVKRFFNK